MPYFIGGIGGGIIVMEIFRDKPNIPLFWIGLILFVGAVIMWSDKESEKRGY